MNLKWGSKYKYAIQTWQYNWKNLTQYFNYPLEIRKIINPQIMITKKARQVRAFLVMLLIYVIKEF
jgi:putative transposase